MATTGNKSTRVDPQPSWAASGSAADRADPDALWRQFESADRVAARARVDALRRKYPTAPPATLHRRLVQAKCVQAGGVGAISGLAGFLPGPFRVLGNALGPLADATIVTTLQGELVLETFELFDIELPQSAERFAVFAIAASNVGSVAVSQSLVSSIARFASQSMGGRILSTAAPVVGLATTLAANIGLTYAIGQRALAVARLRDANLAEWPELLRSVTEIDERKLIAWAQQSARAAVVQVSATTLDWVKQLGARLPTRLGGTKPPARKRSKPKAARAKPAARKSPIKKTAPREAAAKKKPARKAAPRKTPKRRA